MSSGGYIVVKKNSTANATNATNTTSLAEGPALSNITSAANDTEPIANETQFEETSPASGLFAALSPLLESIENFMTQIWNSIKSALGF
jgi:hypothetical protein